MIVLFIIQIQFLQVIINVMFVLPIYINSNLESLTIHVIIFLSYISEFIFCGYAFIFTQIAS